MWLGGALSARKYRIHEHNAVFMWVTVRRRTLSFLGDVCFLLRVGLFAIEKSCCILATLAKVKGMHMTL